MIMQKRIKRRGIMFMAVLMLVCVFTLVTSSVVMASSTQSQKDVNKSSYVQHCKKEWADANARGDQKAMDKAHDKAENYRKNKASNYEPSSDGSGKSSSKHSSKNSSSSPETKTTYPSNILEQMQNNSKAWIEAETQKEKDKLHDENEKLRAKYDESYVPTVDGTGSKKEQKEIARSNISDSKLVSEIEQAVNGGSKVYYEYDNKGNISGYTIEKTETKKFSELSEIEKDKVLNDKIAKDEVSTFIEVDGVKQLLNEKLWKEKGIIAYGDPLEISESENLTSHEAVKGDEPRYLGYDIYGNIYSNQDFPADVGSSNKAQYRNWLTPEELKRNITAANLIHYDPTDQNDFVRQDKLKTAEQFLTQNPSWGQAGWTSKKIVENFKFNQVIDGSGLTQGSFVGVHQTASGNIYYDDFIVSRGDPVYEVPSVTTKEVAVPNNEQTDPEEEPEVKQSEAKTYISVKTAGITVQGKNNKTGDIIYSSSYHYKLKKGESVEKTYVAKQLSGYKLVGIDEKSVAVTYTNLNKTVIFKYEFLPIEHEDGYIYNSDTDVITSVIVKAENGNITNDDKAYVTFKANGQKITKAVTIPSGGRQLVYIKWHTPDIAQNIDVSISISGNSSAKIEGLRIATIPVRIVNLNENEPPNPKADDRNDGFIVPNVPNKQDKKTITWGEWNCIGKVNGYWEYSYISYTASITAEMSVNPDEKIPTSTGKTMKSGYGINIEAKANVNTNAPSSAVTGAQNIISYYPEFNYANYWRVLEMMQEGYRAEFKLQENKYSTYNSRVHFTPIWYPNGRYTVYVEVVDTWTPAGMLKVNLDDDINIDGNLYQDWHIGPK
jgi:hypothetical protein